VSLLSDFGQKKSRRPFSDFLLGMPLCERRIFSFESSGQVVPMCGESVKLEVNKIAARWPAKAVAQFFYFF